MVRRIVNASVTKEILRENGIRLTKRLGQHFLIDPNILKREVDEATLGRKDTVVEVGPGIGTLTQLLAESAGRVLAIEHDSRFIRILKKTLAEYSNVSVVEGDALTADINSLLGDRQTVKLVSNLPYNVATPIISRVLEEIPMITTMVVMVQKEVAQRMLAVPRTKAYGFFTLKVKYYADVASVMRVPHTVFLPQPKVDSMIVTLTRRTLPSVDVKDTHEYFRFIQTFFNERRKTVRAIMMGRLKDIYGSERVSTALEKMASDTFESSVRPEELELDGFAYLFGIVTANQP